MPEKNTNSIRVPSGLEHLFRETEMSREDAERLVLVLSPELYPPGQGRTETVVMQCGSRLPGWLVAAHTEKNGMYGVRVTSMSLGDKLTEHEDLISRVAEAWESYKQRRGHEAEETLDELLLG